MDIIDLGSPVPRTPPTEVEDFVFPISNRTYLPVPKENIDVNFFETILNRESRREFSKAPIDHIANLLWYSSKVFSTKKLDLNHVWQHRPTPSAGGRHPIDILIIPSPEEKDVRVYDPIAHTLGHISSLDMNPIDELFDFLESNFSTDNATVLWFVAQYKKTTSAYENATSLIYRDVGALEATIGLTAEAVGLNHCSIGITGEPWISNFFKTPDGICGVGGMLIGAPT
jgi:SagB-type dehydrogenase family enzyme